jgi:hypothetical protein
MSVIVVFRVEIFKSYFSSHVGMTKMSPGAFPAAMGKTSKAENSRERKREKSDRRKQNVDAPTL